MFTRKDLDDLRSLHSQNHPVLSAYLNTDGRSVSRKQVETRLKEMGRLAVLRSEHVHGREYGRAAMEEVRAVEHHIGRHYREFHCRGMALFSCSGMGFLREVALPRPPRDRLTLGETPFTRPLQFQELEHRRFCTVILDRSAARIYLIHKGAILEHKHLADPVPAKVKSGGFDGYEGTRRQRKVDGKISAHFRHTADTVFELFQRDRFEWLIIGCRQEYLREFESYLHSYLKTRLAAHMEMPADTPEHTVLERSTRVEKGLVFKDHCRLVEDFHRTFKSGSPAVMGIQDTLRHLNSQAVQSIIVARDFQQSGVRCPHCDFLGILEEVCPSCGTALAETPDVVTDAIDKAMGQNCDVQQVFEGVGMEALQQVGAVLRFRV